MLDVLDKEPDTEVRQELVEFKLVCSLIALIAILPGKLILLIYLPVKKVQLSSFCILQSAAVWCFHRANSWDHWTQMGQSPADTHAHSVMVKAMEKRDD